LIIIIIVVFLIAVLYRSHFRFIWQQNPKQALVNNIQTVTSTSATSSIETSQTTTSANLHSDYLPEVLKPLPDLHLIRSRDSSTAAEAQYFEVSGISVGAVKLILMSTYGYCDGIGCTPGYYRFLKNGNTFTLLTKYSPPVDGDVNLVKTDLNTSRTSAIDVPALDVPTQLQDPKTNSIVKLDHNSFTTRNLFNPENKRLIFEADGYKIYSVANIINFETFYAQAPDGKELIYTLSDPFIKNQGGGFAATLDINWTDVQAHSNKYQFDISDSNNDIDWANCEEGNDYVKAVSSTIISQDDLKTVGTNSSGQVIYGFKDLNNPILKMAQDRTMYLGNKAHADPADLIIFWKDPFGRLVRFVSSDMLAACGA